MLTIIFENKEDTKLIRKIDYIMPFPSSNNKRKQIISKIVEIKEPSKNSIFEGLKGLNVKEREFYNSL